MNKILCRGGYINYMYGTVANKKRNYGVKSYIVNTMAEIDAIPVSLFSTTPGSTVLVMETGDKYILNLNRHWELLTTSEGAGGDGPDAVIYEGGDLMGETEQTDINYDGGSLT